LSRSFPISLAIFQSWPFAKITLAQETVAGEAKKRQCGLRVQALRNSRILTAASQYPSRCRCILNRRRKRENQTSTSRIRVPWFGLIRLSPRQENENAIPRGCIAPRRPRRLIEFVLALAP
jgi:hypothetical protein